MYLIYGRCILVAAVVVAICIRGLRSMRMRDKDDPDQQAQRGGGGPTKPVVPK